MTATIPSRAFSEMEKRKGANRHAGPSLLVAFVLIAGLDVFAVPPLTARGMEVAPTLSFQGSTASKETSDDEKTSAEPRPSRLFSRNLGLGLELRGQHASESREMGFEYAMQTEIRFDIARNERTSAGNPYDRSAPPRPPGVLVLPFGPAWAGARFSPYASTVFGYVPDRHVGEASDAEPFTTHHSLDVLLRRSLYPALHLQLELPGLGVLRLTPLQLLDSPGRVAPDSLPFGATAREASALRFREGELASGVSPDRFGQAGDVALDVDAWVFGAGFRSARLLNTGASSASQIQLLQSRIEGGYAGPSFYAVASFQRASGIVRETGGDQTSIDAFRGIIATGWHGHTAFVALYAMQTQPSRRHRSDGEDRADRLGWIDTDSSPADLPVLGGTYGILLHPVPCAVTTVDRCEGTVASSAAAPGFRSAGRYGDLTIGLRRDRWHAALRSGLLVPSPDVLPSSPGVKQMPYADYAEIALEMGVSSPSGAFVMAYGAEHRRSPETGHRILDGQALSVLARVHFEGGPTTGNRAEDRP